MRLKSLAFVSVLALAGCAIAPRTTTTTYPPPLPPEETGHYEPIPGRGPDVVADLRAASAPAEPDYVAGRDFAAERARLRSQGFMQIGTSHFPAADPDAKDDALRQGQRVGADRAIAYAPAADSPGAMTTVAYYVRFKLPFGATFRDLHDDERAAAGTDGGVAIGSVIGDTPASRANLLGGDLVLKLDGTPVGNRAKFQALLREHAGRPVTLTIVRNGVTLKRMVRLGVIPDADRE